MDAPSNPSFEHQDAEEARPAKRVKLDGALEVTEDIQEEIVDDEGWDDIYGTEEPDAAVEGKTIPLLVEEVVGSGPSPPENEADTEVEDVAANSGIPKVVEVPVADVLPLAPNGEHTEELIAQVEEKTVEAETEVEDGVPAEAVDDGEALIAEVHHVTTIDEPSLRMLEDVSAVNGDPNAKIENPNGEATSNDDVERLVTDEAGLLKQTDGAVQKAVTGLDAEGDGVEQPPVAKATDDPEFMAAAAAQKENAVAEWQFDASDAESDKDASSSSDSDSDTSSEEEYEMLDAATAAKILMQGEGDDEDEGGKGKKGGDRQPRTQNEVKVTVIPKPQVTITESDKITLLGTVERAVEAMILIKGATPGEYQVLESGSVLCTTERTVFGVVAETLGRVQEPMYSVAFNSAQEIKDASLEEGVKVYYVDAHSTFVFTQPLKNMKWTDASNIHDEEVGDEEMEFSDDEAEAEYKRMKKLAKKGGRGGMGAVPGRGGRGGHENGPRTFGAPGHDSGQTYVNGSGNDTPSQQSYGGALSYDDDDVADEFYSPLKRPDNLSQMMASSGSPPPPRPQPNGSDRGRGRGRGDRGRGRGDRGRGRGDRGRGRAGFNNDRGPRGGGRGGSHEDGSQRGGGGGERGAHGGQTNGGGHRGNAQSFPDRHNNDGNRASQHYQQPLPPRPAGVAMPSASPPPSAHHGQPQQYAPSQSYGSYPQASHQQQPPQTQNYQFGGYTFQYGNPAAPARPQAQTQHPQQTAYAGYRNQQQQQQQAYQQSPPAGAIPPGAYVNPAFYQGHPQQHQQQTGGYGAWPQQQQQAQQQYPQQQGYGGGAGALTAQQQQANLAEILRRMGGN
ncbi:hypothetical protein LTR48_005070 [Friedmanniomyces endolithicus]|uniref:H/ACA ribonucleoprotein complex non-core subunit NAF1 n=1 Tax=Rachicladosporium monterosium TaxID=1507873 RepID=A0ABR0L593_9PEZI|nr:hypothetical protein LTR48_005070 [Friedmanniomyces endolithicus]KAK5142808.1 hypothetical protein LTR32_004934 [Rachicladosporium monterosium]